MTPEFFAAGTSPWFARTLNAHPQWAAAIESLAAVPLTRSRLAEHSALLRLGAPYRDEAHLRAVLRDLRNQAFAALMERDLSARADLDEVMRAMTALAEFSIDEALNYLSFDLAARFGAPIGLDSGSVQDLLVIGMGKLGGRELNVSSDVDLVFVYEEEGDTEQGTPSRSLANQEFFTRLARRLIGVLSERTAEGFVFRVDMRLRPNGDAGPLVVSLAMLEEYFVAQGRSWERYAWIKARPVSEAVLGSEHGRFCERLEAVVQPFVYRRYLDFGAIEALRALHAQIRSEVARRDAAHPDRAENVKLGRGGIREIEFIAQHFQLIRGGRDPALRERSTIATLNELVDQGLLEAAIGQRLIDAYRLLRNIEHRLQYLEDAQTHSLPTGSDERARLARMCARYGITDFAELQARLRGEQAFVAEQFDEVFGSRLEPAPGVNGQREFWSEGSLPLDTEDAALLEWLAKTGYADPKAASLRVVGLESSPKARTLSEVSRARLDSLIPQCVVLGCRYATATCAPIVLLGRLLDLLETIATRAAYLAFLNEFPRALERVAALLAASPWAARYLNQHPLLLDELLDTRARSRADWGAVAIDLARELARSRGDVERQMDLLRETHHAQTWSLLILDLEDRLTVEELSDDLSALADVILQASVDACWQLVADDPAEPCALAIIAYGKLGGKELGYASDLDLVFLCGDGAADAPVALCYARLAQRLMTWLTSRTTAGGLFEVDLRLRPDGAAGLLVTTLQGFLNYQQKHAWVWEHQALTRARFSAGDVALGRVFERERRKTLAKPRELDALRAEIVAMRLKMHAAHPNPSQEFDLKHDAGGMVDIEFCVQYLVLGFAHQFESLLDDVGNIALLGRAAQCGLVPEDLANAVAQAYRRYRRRQHTLRLSEAAYARAPLAEFVQERQSVFELCQALHLALGIA